MSLSSAPIGVFDSGVGGLSILQSLATALPAEWFVYQADAAHAPYGERDDCFIIARCFAIAEALLAQHRIKALVVACNTATTVAIQALRSHYTQLPIIGVEPAVKPAVALSASSRIAVLATARTLQSAKYLALVAQFTEHAELTHIACSGLARAIELADSAQIEKLCAHYIGEALDRGVDTVVLGCTHYPLAEAVLRRHAGNVRLIDSGAAVAQQTQKRLAALGVAADSNGAAPTVLLRSSGDLQALAAVAQRYLGTQVVLRLSENCAPEATVRAETAAACEPQAQPR